MGDRPFWISERNWRVYQARQQGQIWRVIAQNEGLSVERVIGIVKLVEKRLVHPTKYVAREPTPTTILPELQCVTIKADGTRCRGRRDRWSDDRCYAHRGQGDASA